MKGEVDDIKMVVFFIFGSNSEHKQTMGLVYLSTQVHPALKINGEK